MGNPDQARADFCAAVQAVREGHDLAWDQRNPLRLAVYYLIVGQTEEAQRLYCEALSDGVPAWRIREIASYLKKFLARFPDYPQGSAMRELLQELQETEQ
jgi:hypothetical protein